MSRASSQQQWLIPPSAHEVKTAFAAVKAHRELCQQALELAAQMVLRGPYTRDEALVAAKQLRELLG